MKEYMFYIRNLGDGKATLSNEEHRAFVQKCEVYIGTLKAEGKLIAAQPILREGIILSKTEKGWNKVALDQTGEIQVGYYHIRAKDLDDAIEIAKANPEFEYVHSATIEIHQIKTKEEETGFVYPRQ